MNNDYKQWIVELKQKIRSAQIKAAIAINTELIEFYWFLGKMIAEKESVWGSKLIEQVAKDLREEFPDMSGLSASNLKYCKRFYLFYQIGQQAVDQLQSIDKQPNEFVHQVVGRIPWGHNIRIFTKANDIQEALFYIQQTSLHNWSRDLLALQIKSNLYERQGKAITNFSNTLPLPNSDLAQQTLKDPYIFDFVNMTTQSKERDIETQLTTNITRFLLELG